MRRCRITLPLFLLSLLFALPTFAQGPVEVTVYHSPSCGYCALTKEQVLGPLQEEYGERLALTWVDVSTAEGLAQLEAEEARLNDRDNPLPVLVFPDKIVANEDPTALEQELRAAIEAGLAQGSSASSAAVAAPLPGSASGSSAAASPVHAAYVKKVGCDTCARAELVINAVREAYPNLQVTEFDVLTEADQVEAMGQYLGLPQTERLIAPSIYVGDRALVGGEAITSGNLRELVDGYAQDGAPVFWQTLDARSGERSIAQRFRTMGPWAVVVAALIDGINPCAFATIIFFVSYLAISRRSRSALLAVGLAFTVGVFVTYLVVGLGAMRLLQVVSSIRIVGVVLYGFFALGCFMLAGISLRDYVLARRGRLHEMALNLPDPLRERIKGRIRKTSGAFLGAAFASGLIVSLLELACTGQVYLPTITFMVGVPEMRASAVGYLLLYNSIFVAPLLVVLLLATYGVSATRFQDWFVRHAATAKLVMAALFLALGALLLMQALSL